MPRTSCPPGAGRSQHRGTGQETRGGGGGVGGMSKYQLPVVIDNGSEVIKAGLAGSREPQFMYPNIIGRVKGQSWAAQELWVGDQAQNQRSSLSIRYRLFLAGRTRGMGEQGEPR